FRPVQGWIRTTEVTRGSDGSAHPHFHTLMMVPPGMLNGKSYVSHERWVELWRECLRGDNDTNGDVRAVKPRKPKGGESLA
ncbi:protein rep, partial [Salmonella enterica]|uniref:protein rep n=1 Tax=Salmonella enterica TaxID=28901 RepID=UPI0007A86959